MTVPVGFTAISPSGSGYVTAVSATLNGAALTLTTTTGVGTAATATGAASLSLSQAGTYTLVYSATDAYGPATPATVTFTVIQEAPPTITITAPASGSTVTIPAGSKSVAVALRLHGATTYARTIQVGLGHTERNVGRHGADGHRPQHRQRLRRRLPHPSRPAPIRWARSIPTGWPPAPT